MNFESLSKRSGAEERFVAMSPAVPFTVCSSANVGSMRVVRIMWILLIFLSASTQCSWGQALPTATHRMAAGFFATAGGANTQLPRYADNALGFNFGAYIQPFRLLGGEVRGGTYPIKARYTQSPVTAGLRIGGRRLGESRWIPYGYIGGGVSKAQDSGVNSQPTAAVWSRCWQASAGVDINFGRFSWRAADASWTKTYTAQRDLRTLSLSTGVVYHFGLSR
jgi:hypothetical protein